MDSSEFECGVCSNMFSDIHCPMIIPCSHTFCGGCIDGIISTQNKICPVCRKAFTATSSKDLTVNRIALNVAKQLSSSYLEAKVPIFCSETSSIDPKGTLEEILNEFRKKMAIPDIQAVEEETVRLLEYLDAQKDDALKFKQEIEGMLSHLQEFVNKISENTEELRSNLSVIRTRKEKIQDLCGRLAEKTTYSSAADIMDEADKVRRDVQANVKKQEELLQKEEKIKQNTKQLMLDWKEKTSRIADKMIKRIKDSEKEPIKVNDLKYILDLLSRKPPREVIALQEYEGKQRVATIKIECDNRISVSHFRERNIPLKSIVIEVDPLIEMSSRRVFLDLGVDDTLLGRMIIKLNDGNYALNFLHMCLGDLGPSYANSRVSGVSGKGKNHEVMLFGKYEVNGETTSAAVLPDVDWEKEYKRKIYKEPSWQAGYVKGYITFLPSTKGLTPGFSHNTASQFNVATRDNPIIGRSDLFGVVEEGLDVLRNCISRYSNVEEIKILNCGLLISV